MLSIKKQFIKNMIKLEVVSNTPGKLELYISQIKKVEDEYKVYEVYADRMMKLLKGVKGISVDYDRGLLTVNYEETKLNPRQVYGWIQTMVDVGIEYYDEIKQSWNKNSNEAAEVEKVWNKMEPVLKSKLK